jgi:ankyrin repeat protein
MLGLLIRSGALVNAANEYGVTPLALACANGSKAAVDVLLEAKANVNAARPTGETPLMTAARSGNADIVRLLLTAGADPKAVSNDYKQNALMWAIAERHVAVVRALLNHGADLSARSSGGFTPLLFAARYGDPEIADLLLAAGADARDAAAGGNTALLVAAVRGHVDVAKALLRRGADPNVAEAGYTVLHWAAGLWETELSGPNGVVAEGEWRAVAGLSERKLELVQALLSHGADPNARMAKNPPRVGYTQLNVEHNVAGVNPFPDATPFLLAAMAADVPVMRALVAAGADPKLVARDGTTALMLASGLGRYPAENSVTENQAIEAVKASLALGNDVNAVNKAGNTALHGAALIKANTIIRLLVESGAAMDVKNNRGQTAVTLADTIRAGSATTRGRTPTGDLLRELIAERSK